MKNIGFNVLFIFCLLLAGGFFVLTQKYHAATARATELEQKAQSDAAMVAKMRRQLTLLQDSDTQPVALTNGPGGKAWTMLYYNQERHEMALNIGGIPAPDTGVGHHCWAFQGEKMVYVAPVSLTETGNWQELPYVDKAVRFCISTEPSGKQPVRPTVELLNGVPSIKNTAFERANRLNDLLHRSCACPRRFVWYGFHFFIRMLYP